MFTIKKGLVESMQMFQKHKGQFLAYAFGWAIIIASSFYFSYIYGFVIVAVVLIYLPLELSLTTISKKAYDHIELENADFYIGFKALMISITLYAKVMLKGFLWALLVGFLLTLIGSSIALFAIVPEVLDLVDYNSVMTTLLENETLVNALTIISLLSFVLAGLVYNLKSFSGHIAPYVLLETGFDINSCKAISDNMTQKDKKVITLSKLMFYGYYVVAILVGVLVGYLLISNHLLTEQYGSFAGFLTASILIAPIHMLAKLYYSYLYRSKYQEGVRQQFQDYVNVQMRISQEQFLKQNQEEKKDDKESKNDSNDEGKSEK